jgi:predicted Zn finger-like uncharacterized protein
MIVTCSGCNKRYNFDESKLSGRASGTLRCPACNTSIKVSAPSPGDQTTRLDADANLVAARPQASEGSPRLPKDERISLAVLEGKNAGQIFQIDRPRVILGRTGADIALDDSEISRQHACLEIHGLRIVLKDLGSTNGTFVDENKISQMEIENRSEFRLGGTRFMLIMTESVADPGTVV